MIRFPWTAETMPHVVLEINQDCNLACRGCYKLRRGGYRTVDDVMRDVETAMSACRLQTVCLVGAEPTLHPDLPAIVEGLHRLGLKSSLASNGLLLDPSLLARLKAAGLDIVMLHVDEGQDRPDLPPHPSLEATNTLRAELAGRVAAAGIDVGLSVMIHPEHFDRLPGVVQFVLESEHVNYLFAAHFVNMRKLRDFSHGRVCSDTKLHPPVPSDEERTTNRDTIRILRETFALKPFAYLPSQLRIKAEEEFPSWVSYFVPVIIGPGRFRFLPVESGWMDRLLLLLMRRITGRFFFYIKANPRMIAAHLILNALALGRIGGTLRFLAAARGPNARLGAKRMVFDNGPMMTPDGQVTCVELCPNRTVKDGRLVPVCKSDVEEGGCLAAADG